MSEATLRSAPSVATRLPLRAARVVAGVVVSLVLVSILTFAASNVRSPDEVARATLGRDATAAQRQAFLREHDLDGSIVERYGSWATGIVQGDMGTSPVTGRPVADDVLPRLQRSLVLALIAAGVAIPLSLVVAVTIARVGGRVDLTVVICATVLTAFPEFVVGIGLLLLLAVAIAWLPVESTAVSGGTPSEVATAYVLPALTLVLAVSPYLIRLARAAVRDALQAPFVKSAVLRGLPRRRVVWRYAMTAAAAPIVNAVAICLVYLIGGAIVVENVFAFPGIGQLLVQAIANGDAVTVQAITVMLGASFVLINLAADALVRYLNPRLKTMQR